MRKPSTGRSDVRLFCKFSDNQAAAWTDYPAEDDETDEGIAWLIRKDYCYIFTQRLGQFVIAESTDVYEDVNQNNNNNGDDADEYEHADSGTELPHVLVNGDDNSDDDDDDYESMGGCANDAPDEIQVFLILKNTSATGYRAEVMLRSDQYKENYPNKEELESQGSFMTQACIPYCTGPIHVELTSQLPTDCKLVTGNSLEMDIVSNNRSYFDIESVNQQMTADLDVTISLYAPGSTNIFSQCLPCFGSGDGQGTLITQLTGRLQNSQRYVDAPSIPVQESVLADGPGHARQEYSYVEMQQAPNTESFDVMSSGIPSVDVIQEIPHQQHMLSLGDSPYQNLPNYSSDIIVESIKTNLLPGLGEMSMSAFREVVCKADPEFPFASFGRNITPKRFYKALKMSCKNDNAFDEIPIMQYLRNLYIALGEVGEIQSSDCLEFLLQKEQLRRNQAEICRNLRLDNIVPKLEASQVISRDDRAIFNDKRNNGEKSEHLIQEIVLKSDKKKFCDFIEALNDTGQCHIVKMFSLDSICRGF